jgi:RNA recognition motif-containing protein
MTRHIQVWNLSDSVDRVVLQQLFEAHGGVRSATINRHFETGFSTGVGVVQMESDEDGEAAIAALNHREHFGRELSVCWSEGSNIDSVDREQMFGPMNMLRDLSTVTVDKQE